jgi:hypothetical protein
MFGLWPSWVSNPGHTGEGAGNKPSGLASFLVKGGIVKQLEEAKLELLLKNTMGSDGVLPSVWSETRRATGGLRGRPSSGSAGVLTARGSRRRAPRGRRPSGTDTADLEVPAGVHGDNTSAENRYTPSDLARSREWRKPMGKEGKRTGNPP